MINEFLILELGTDTSDSLMFRNTMVSALGGKDVTPPCSYPGTRNGLTVNLNGLPKTAWKSATIQSWMDKFVKTSPAILYISGHHLTSNYYTFYNDHDFGAQLLATGIRYGDTSGKWEAKSSRVATSNNYLKNLVLVVVDACNIAHNFNFNEAREFQKRLSFGSGKPIIVGFQGKSPVKGTATLHKKFLELLPKGKDVLQEYAKGGKKQNELVEKWVKAGKAWKHKAQDRLVALDNQGKVYNHKGKTDTGVMDYDPRSILDL